MSKTTTLKVSRTEMMKMIDNTNGQFFAVTFKKNDGTIRKVNGNKKKNSTTKLGYVMINDLAKKEVVSFDPKNLISFTFKNINYVKK